MKIKKLLGKVTAIMLAGCLLACSGLKEIGGNMEHGVITLTASAAGNVTSVSDNFESKNIDTSVSSHFTNVTNMNTDIYGTISNSYFYKESGKYYMVNHEDNKIYIDIYNANMKKISSKTIDDELSLFGGFYSGEKYNFIVYGKSYSSSDKETYRIVKYDKSFNRISSLSIDGDKTYTKKPFEGGTSSFAEKNNTLIFYTARLRMGDSDGYNHQSNITLRINEDDMTISDEYYGAASSPTNHCSHAMREIVKVDNDGSEIYATLSDRYPCCGVSIIKLNKDGKMGIPAKSNVVYTEIEHPEYDPYSMINETDAEVNGLVITDNSYIVTGVFYDNVFVGAVDKTTGNISKTMLTNYNEYSEYGLAQESKLVQINRNESIILWQTIVDGISSVNYDKVDAKGEIKGEIKTAFNALLSDCQPIYDEGTIRWYTIVNGENTLYTISDLEFDGTFEPLGSKIVDAENIWNGKNDTSWYNNSKSEFTISTAEQLSGLSELVNAGNDMNGKKFVLNSDIYLNADEGNQVFTPIASVSSGVQFSGIFDGNGYTIYRLYRIEADDSTEGGLFGTVGEYGVIRNLTIDQSYIRQDAGAFAATNYGTIMFCENMGQVTSTIAEGSHYIGGIVGETYGMVYGCANKGRVIGYYGWAGGISGYVRTVKGCVKACYNSGCVSSGGFAAGGIVGQINYVGTVEDCFNIGTVLGSVTANFANYSNYAGGIVGGNYDGYIVNCISLAYVNKAEFNGSADSVCGDCHSSFGKDLIYDCYSLYDTEYAEKVTLEEMTSDSFLKKLNSVIDFYETRLNDMWVKGNFLPVTIAQKADEMNFYKFYPTACIWKDYRGISETHFGFAKSEYKSSNEKIVSVNENGKVTYNGGVGKAVITLTIPETEISAEEVYYLDYPRYGIAFKNEYEKLTKGKTLQLSLDKYYKTTPEGGVSYSSDNTAVATVSSEGKVTAISKGSATITARHDSYKATCQIYVTDGGTVLTSGKCGANLSYSLSTDGTMTFTGSGEMTSAPWTDYNPLIEKIIFPKNISNIYRYAFSGCKLLKNVSIPSNVKTVETSAFADCISLKSITLSDGIEVIESYAFYCSGITGITIPESITQIGYEAFGGCYSLKEITSNSRCDSMVNGFGDQNTMEHVEVIYGIAGTEASSLAKSFKIDFIPLSNKNFTVSGGASELIINKYIGSSNNVIVPSKIDGIDVVSVDDNCFVGNSKIVSVKLPDTFSEIPSFKNCTSLKDITLPSNMKKIFDRSFFGCSSLTDIEIPEGTESIGEYAFYNCKNLRNITIPRSVTSFERYAFTGCDQLKCIVIPAQLDSISVYGLLNESFTTIYGNSDLIGRACRDHSFLSNISYFTIPTQKTTFTDNDITVSGYLPPNTVMEVLHENGVYTIKFINNGKEIEPCGDIMISVSNVPKNKYVVEIYSDGKENYANTLYEFGRYTFNTQSKSFHFIDGLKGDTNGDGKATIADSLMIARYEVKLRTLTETQLAVSDVNYDGKVTIADALKIARYEVKLINSL